jgi:hypothetical protein
MCELHRLSRKSCGAGDLHGQASPYHRAYAVRGTGKAGSFWGKATQLARTRLPCRLPRLVKKVIARTNAPLAPFRCSGFSGNVALRRSRHRWRRDFAPTSRRWMPSISRRNIERPHRKRGEPDRTVGSPPPAGPNSRKQLQHTPTVTTFFESPCLRPSLQNAVPQGNKHLESRAPTTPRIELASAASDRQVTDQGQPTSPLSFAAGPKGSMFFDVKPFRCTIASKETSRPGGSS